MASFLQTPAPAPGAGGKVFVQGLRCGRLANRMVLFANLIACAAEHGHRVVNVTFHSYAHLFETTHRDIYCRYPVPARRSFLDVVPGVAPALRKLRLLYHLTRCASVLNERFPLLGKSAVTLREIPREIIWLDSPAVQNRIRDARLVFIYGWRFRAPKSVARHADKIRSYFQPVVEIGHASRQVVERLRQMGEVVVGVHLRQGDYRTWKQGKHFFPPERYAVWMRELAGQFPGRRVAFFVCSDEPRQAAEFPGLPVVIGAGPPLVDLCTLAGCDYVFGPPSTFSQWASFYGNKPLLFLNDREDRIERDRFAISYLEEIP